ncbi:MAG: twin-arginine translocation signal domain-containing protein [Chloroflexota bacterium]
MSTAHGNPTDDRLVSRVSRRGFLGRTGLLAGGALAASGLIQACATPWIHD